jgi:hypothetical protein
MTTDVKRATAKTSRRNISTSLLSPLSDGTARYWLGPDRQKSARKVWEILAPFERDYYAFFNDRPYSFLPFLHAGRGEKFGRVMLTVDGDYTGHYNQIVHWLGRS